MAETPKRGALAQLGERLHGMQEVSGSIPLGSTKFPQHFVAFGTSIQLTATMNDAHAIIR